MRTNMNIKEHILVALSFKILTWQSSTAILKFTMTRQNVG